MRKNSIFVVISRILPFVVLSINIIKILLSTNIDNIPFVLSPLPGHFLFESFCSFGLTKERSVAIFYIIAFLLSIIIWLVSVFCFWFKKKAGAVIVTIAYFVTSLYYLFRIFNGYNVLGYSILVLIYVSIATIYCLGTIGIERQESKKHTEGRLETTEKGTF